MKLILPRLASLSLAFILSACSISNAAESNDLFLRKGVGLSISAANYVNRSVFFRLDDGHNGGGLADAGSNDKPGSSGSMCCFTVTNLNKPVKVEMRWAAIKDPPVLGADGALVDGKVLTPSITKQIFVKPPPRMPHIIPNDHIKSENIMCVIFKSLDTVELKYSNSYDC
ncbi:DUF3304 domain-containing protein [Chromobacterium vaccinii]|uniref:DUF3304 domain-containing protein n=1 Tax=Chromobacterium vaccinii TaxID=1108595 RepID=UPI001186F589|nr:DUF3304 domain-containing protein [Chromobacterium vaccinii]